MANEKTKDIYIKKKRRVIGEIVKVAEIKSANAWLSIHGSSKEFLLTYESEGLVVSINGSGTLKTDHPQAQDAAKITEYVMKQGGIILNGGRESGIMESSSKVGKENAMGIIFPELEKEASKYGPQAVVNAPTPRIELLSTCAPVTVIFRGGLGTLMMLMRAITHVNNRKFHPNQASQLVFISNYWIGLLQTMINMEALPKEFLKDLDFFGSADEIIKKISKVS